MKPPTPTPSRASVLLAEHRASDPPASPRGQGSWVQLVLTLPANASECGTFFSLKALLQGKAAEGRPGLRGGQAPTLPTWVWVSACAVKGKQSSVPHTQGRKDLRRRRGGRRSKGSGPQRIGGWGRTKEKGVPSSLPHKDFLSSPPLRAQRRGRSALGVQPQNFPSASCFCLH